LSAFGSILQKLAQETGYPLNLFGGIEFGAIPLHFGPG